VRAQREVLVGDRLIPEENVEYPEFLPRAPEHQMTGSVISVMDALSQVGTYQIVVLDRGGEVGLQPGHVLSIYQSGVFVDDKVGARRVGTGAGGQRHTDQVELPNEQIGDLMVFRVFPKVSYGLVMRAQRSIHINDTVRNPE
jgi:hypothetical protein